MHLSAQDAIIGTMTILIVTMIATLAVSGLCSILEAVLLSIDTSFVEMQRAEGRRSGRLLHELKSHIDQPIAAILTLNTVAHTAGAAFAGSLAYELFGSAWVAGFSAVFTFAILVFSEIIPKTAGARFCKELAALVRLRPQGADVHHDTRARASLLGAEADAGIGERPGHQPRGNRSDGADGVDHGNPG